MIAVRGPSSGSLAPASLVIGAVAALAASAVSGTAIKPALALAFVAVVFATLHRGLLSWSRLISLIVAIVLFIPMRRYALPASLPFQLDPYRVIVALVIVAWLASLLVDSRVRLASSKVNGPLLSVLLIAVASIAANYPSVSAAGTLSTSIKELTFLASYLCFFYLVVSVVRTFDEVDSILRMFVGGTAFVGGCAIVELWTHYNLFDHLATAIPLLHRTAAPLQVIRGGHLRTLASSQHPIALGALFAMVAPIAVYLFKLSGHRRWLVAVVIFGMGAASTGSRTAVVMLVVVVAIFLVLRPCQTMRLWPAIIPLVVLIHFAMPGTIGGYYKLFFPSGGLVAEQANAAVGSSRVASLGPGLHLIGLDPLLGGGYGARVFFNPADPNAFIVDDQWLSTGIDTGILGVAAWAWLFLRFLRPMFSAARSETGSRGWFFTSVAASTTAYVVGMFTFDAYSFIQTTFAMFLIVAVGCAALRAQAEQAPG